MTRTSPESSPSAPLGVIHADWGVNPDKRIAAIARPAHSGGYEVGATRQVGRTGSCLERLGVESDSATNVLVGFDFPIGIPRAYARVAGIDSFRDALPRFGLGEWREFYEVCRTPDEVGLRRPFFPQSCRSKGECTWKHLEAGLQLSKADLYRLCELKTEHQGPASPLFWTLGAKQVGKGAISGWQEFIGPMLADGALLWPFDGDLPELLGRSSCVIAETYPAEFYVLLGLRFLPGKGNGKTSQVARQRLTPDMLRVAGTLGVELTDAARAEIEDGFGGGSDGEDRFDAMVGLLGMLTHLAEASDGERLPAPEIRAVEGWMLGQTANVSNPLLV